MVATTNGWTDEREDEREALAAFWEQERAQLADLEAFTRRMGGRSEQERWESALVTQRLATLVQCGAVVVLDPADMMEGK